MLWQRFKGYLTSLVRYELSLLLGMPRAAKVANDYTFLSSGIIGNSSLSSLLCLSSRGCAFYIFYFIGCTNEETERDS
jgi:hypothetical protein